MVEAPGYRKLVTAFYPEGDQWLASDAVFGVKKSLMVVGREFRVVGLSFESEQLTSSAQGLSDVNDDTEARKRGFPKGGSFKLLKFDIVLVPEEEAQAAFERAKVDRAKNSAA